LATIQYDTKAFCPSNPDVACFVGGILSYTSNEATGKNVGLELPGI